MCIRPNTLANGVDVSCRECWQCRTNYVNDWVGRCIAEKHTAVGAHAVTLTYGRDEHGNKDHAQSTFLFYSDVQKYLMLLRRHGFPVRFLFTGEYGSRKGRVHWHGILFWQKAVPPHVLEQNFTHYRYLDDGVTIARTKYGHKYKFWPHGFSYWRTIDHHSAVKYVCKYVQKDLKDQHAQGKLTMSKSPPLGTEYFRHVADKHVAAYLAPQTLKYVFPEVRDKAGAPLEFLLRGAAAEAYLEYFLEAWRLAHGDKPVPPSPVLVEHQDKPGRMARRLRKTLESVQNGPETWTPHQRLVVRDTMLGLDAIEADRQKQAAWDERDRLAQEARDNPPARDMNPVKRRGPRNMDEWHAAFQARTDINTGDYHEQTVIDAEQKAAREFLERRAQFYAKKSGWWLDPEGFERENPFPG